MYDVWFLLACLHAVGFEIALRSCNSRMLLQGGPHIIGNKDIEVKAALPRNYGGSTQLVDKLFVGGLPVRMLGVRLFTRLTPWSMQTSSGALSLVLPRCGRFAACCGEFGLHGRTSFCVASATS